MEKFKLYKFEKPVKANPDAVALLERMLDRAKTGEINRVGMVYKTKDEGWGTVFSASDNKLEDSAMLIEVGLRRLEFITKD